MSTVDTDDEFEIEEYASDDAISDIDEIDQDISEYDVGNDETTYKDRMYMYVMNNLKSIRYKPTDYLKYNQDISIYQPSFIYNYTPIREFSIINVINPERREEISSQFNRTKSLFTKKDIRNIISSETSFTNVIIKNITMIDQNIKIPSEQDIVNFFS